MANQDPPGRRPAEAGDDPAARVLRFRRARAADPRADVADFLPPFGSRDRTPVLIELVKIDLELAAKGGQPTRLEPYLNRFAADLPAAVPLGLLYHEYRVRHQYADAPAVGEYQARFPERYDEFRRYVEAHPFDTPLPPAGTAVPTVSGGPRDFGRTPVDTRSLDPQPQFAPTMPPPPPPPPPRGGPQSVAELIPSEWEYRKVKLLGKGAFGKVYLGYAPGGVPVAIKQLLRGVDHAISKSEQQALEAMRELSHPFLTQIHNFWVEGDQLNIVMELAEGSLQDWIDDCKAKGQPGVPVGELIPFFAQAADALDYLHAQNVSHRDVKPQNLLRSRGYAKVADFGLARVHSRPQQETIVGHECGTPLFMAPEVWRKKVSFQSDQYSLAATYVYARLGRALFEFEFLDQLVLHHLQHDPELDPLPAAEQAVLRKALAKNPEDRFPTCKAFVDALREAVQPPPPPPPAPPPVSAWPRRALVAGSVAAGCGLAYLLFILLSPTPTPAPVPPAVSVPAGWAAVGDEVVEDPTGRRLAGVIERRVGDATVTAVLVPRAGAADPPSFYLLRDKVTNRVMAAAWAAAGADGGSLLNRFRAGKAAVWEAAAKAVGEPGPLPGEWRKGAIPTAGERIPATDQPDVPAVRVTAVEAALAADALGGRLPDYDEWAKAAADRPADQPFDPARWALKRSRPQSVTDPTDDAGPRGVRQMFSNGLEWTRTVRNDRKPMNPLDAPPFLPEVFVNSRSWDQPPAPIPSLDQLKQAYPWYDTKAQIGFRVAIPATP